MFLGNVEAKPGQLFLELARRPLTAVGEEKKALLLPFEPFHEFGYAWKQVVPMVDDSIHVANEGFFCSYVFHFRLHKKPVSDHWKPVRIVQRMEAGSSVFNNSLWFRLLEAKGVEPVVFEELARTGFFV